ncbi:MAG TPA: HEAT repeat domain-containing protein [Candidatus Binatia bacterium]|jgi:hypothetical protein
MNILVLALLPVFFLASAGEQVETVNNKPEVEFRNGRVSIKAEDVLLKDLLEEIGGKGGIEIELKDPKAAEKSVSLDVKNALPGRALGEILQGLNFAFFYSKTGLSRVVIVPPGTPIARGSGGRLGDGGNFTGGIQGKGKKPVEAERKTARDSAVDGKLATIEVLEQSEDPKSVDELGKMLTDQNAEVKSAALDALADKEGANVNQALRRGLNDPDPQFRVEVLEALAERGDLDSLRKALNDPNSDVKEAAADLLEDAKQQ